MYLINYKLLKHFSACNDNSTQLQYARVKSDEAPFSILLYLPRESRKWRIFI